MSHEAVPDQEAERETSVPEQGPPSLLQQMEELMAALNADLTQLDADLQQPTATGDPQQPTPAGDTAPPAPRPPVGDESARS
ncbi:MULTISPECIES: hypothetical protein [unclassified Streptomyces]|uniref:hypothetical protein n=1 Tax=unclassified Streptomyces TaxID=2593676 RepID=UPI00331B0D7B